MCANSSLKSSTVVGVQPVRGRSLRARILPSSLSMTLKTMAIPPWETVSITLYRFGIAPAEGLGQFEALGLAKRGSSCCLSTLPFVSPGRGKIKQIRPCARCGDTFGLFQLRRLSGKGGVETRAIRSSGCDILEGKSKVVKSFGSPSAPWLQQNAREASARPQKWS